MRRLLLIVTVVLIPLRADAQEVVSKGLTAAGKPTVFVTDDQGIETRGKLVTLNDDEVVILVGKEQRRFDTRRVERITRRGDSLRNGAIAGAAFGAGIGLLLFAAADCGDETRGSAGCNTGLHVAWIASAAATYAAIGTAIDAIVQGRTLIYQKPAVQFAANSRAATIAVRLTW